MNQIKEQAIIKPVTLPNGVQVINLTSHAIWFWHDLWDDPVEVPISYVLNADVRTETEWRGKGYAVVSLNYTERPGDREFLVDLKNKYPEAVLVGSIIAAETFYGLVVAPSFYNSAREKKHTQAVRYNRANRFTTKKRK